MFNSISMTQMAATIANAIGAEAPKQADRSIPMVDAFVEKTLGGKKVDRVLIYNPDCVGMWLFQKYTDLFIPVVTNTQLTVPVATVNPSWTPVCFGTMYTGVLPEVHGIQGYAKPVITVDSLFDSLPRSGKKVALVAVEGSSMAIIYNNRPIDYFYLPYDKEVEEKALELIDKDQYDVIVAYTQEYDDVMHRTGVDSLLSMQALRNQIGIFQRLCRKAAESWKDKTSLVAFCPDHGVHQQEDVHGNHGLDIPEDLNIQHFLGVRRAVK